MGKMQKFNFKSSFSLTLFVFFMLSFQSSFGTCVDDKNIPMIDSKVEGLNFFHNMKNSKYYIDDLTGIAGLGIIAGAGILCIPGAGPIAGLTVISASAAGPLLYPPTAKLIATFAERKNNLEKYPAKKESRFTFIISATISDREKE